MKAPQVSARGRLMQDSPIRKLSPLAEDAKRQGVRVHHLNIGQPDIETPPEIRDRLKGFSQKVLAYSPSGGTPEFLRALQGYYATLGQDLGPDEILATQGGSEAVLFALLACADEGDEVLLVEPFYTNYAAFARMAGVKLVPLGTRVEDGFHLPPPAEWERALTKRTRAVLLCNPNNPTGTAYTPAEVESTAEFCKASGLFFIVDEVYREFVYDGRVPSTALSLQRFRDVVVVVDSLSKRYSACGIRLGCLVTRNPEVWAACYRMAMGRLSPPLLAQAIATGLTDVGPEYIRGVVREYESRRDLLYEGLGSLPGVFLRKPEGAFYFVARLPVEDSEDFARWLLTDFRKDGATVMVAPAPGFYATQGRGADEVRIAYVIGGQALRDSIAILRSALEAYPAASRRARAASS